MTSLRISIATAALIALGAACIGLVAGYWGATARVSPRLERWRDSVQVEQAGRAIADAELARRDAEILRYQLVVDSLAARAVPLPPERPAVPKNVPNIGSPSDSAAFWQGEAMAVRDAATQLAADNAILRAEAERRQAQLEATAHLLAMARANVADLTSQRDRLRALIDSAPQGKPRGINLLGLRLCPVIGPGYSFIPGVGQGMALSITQPLSCD